MYECVTIDDTTLFVHLLVISVLVEAYLKIRVLPQYSLRNAEENHSPSASIRGNMAVYLNA
jgi:hypothetical protein